MQRQHAVAVSLLAHLGVLQVRRELAAGLGRERPREVVELRAEVPAGREKSVREKKQS